MPIVALFVKFCYFPEVHRFQNPWQWSQVLIKSISLLWTIITSTLNFDMSLSSRISSLPRAPPWGICNTAFKLQMPDNCRGEWGGMELTEPWPLLFSILETLEPICCPEYGNKSCLVIRGIGKLESELQLGNSAEAEETLQNTYKHLQGSTSNDFSNACLEEKQIINRVEQTYITNASWNSKNGTILFPQTCSQNLFVRSLNVCGVLALKMFSLSISVVFGRSIR